MGDEVVISSDSHVFEPPDLWTKRIDSKFRGREPRLHRVGDEDQLFVEDDHKLGGIGLILGAGDRFDARKPSPSRDSLNVYIVVDMTQMSTYGT